ncbi:alpha/beta hydrolase [soil metagenome]
MATSLEALARETPKQRFKRRLRKAAWNVLFAAMAYALIVLGARLLHRRVLYQPPDEDKEALPEGATLLTARAADGVAVNALEFDVPRARRTIVHFHGNAETASANAFVAREMKKHGIATILVEYRGYGRSRGTRPDEQGLYDDAAAVLDVLAARGVGPDRIVLWGQSLGTGVAAEMARRGRGSRLVLLAPFTSTMAMAQRIVPVLPASLVMVDRFDTLGKAADIAIPTLVVHGDIDDVIPFEQGETLSHAFPHATFLKVPEGRHDNLYKSTTVLSALVAHVGG